MQAVRSTSRKICGMLARKTDARPCTADCAGRRRVLAGPRRLTYDRHPVHIDSVVPHPRQVFHLSLESRRAQIAAILDHQHPAARAAHAAEGRGPEESDVGFGNLPAESTAQLVHDDFVIEVGHRMLLLQAPEPPPPVLDRLPGRLGAGRFLNSSRVMNIVPKFDPYAFKSNDWPEIPTVADTPGALQAISLICRMTLSVRSSEAESGSWMLTRI